MFVFVDEVSSCVCVVLLSYSMFCMRLMLLCSYIYTMMLSVVRLSFLCLSVCCAVADVLFCVCVSCFVLLYM